MWNALDAVVIATIARYAGATTLIRTGKRQRTHVPVNHDRPCNQKQLIDRYKIITRLGHGKIFIKIKSLHGWGCSIDFLPRQVNAIVI